MKRFKTLIKPLIGILAVVPFSLIGVLVAATVSKTAPKETVSKEVKHYEVTKTVTSPTMITDGGTVVIESRDSKISRLSSQTGCLDVGKSCPTATGQRVGVWGETVLKRKPS